jgi:hypothetical protein
MRNLLIFACALPFALGQNATTATTSSSTSLQTPPDVHLDVPNLSVGRIELDVDNLDADINLNANVASLVSINAGVKVSIQEVNLHNRRCTS